MSSKTLRNRRSGFIPSPLKLNSLSDNPKLNSKESNKMLISPFFEGNQFYPSSSNLPRNKPMCSICNFYIDDDLLELSCAHICHRDCFLNNTLTCKKCTESEDADSIDMANTPMFGPIDIPTTPSDQIIQDPSRAPPSKAKLLPPHQVHLQPQLFLPHLQEPQEQLLSPRTSFNKNLNKDLFDSLMKPKIKFIEEIPDQKRFSDAYNHTENLNYIIDIRPPKYFNTLKEDKNIPLKNQVLDEIKFSMLSNVIGHDESVIDFNNLGKLIIFEVIDISSNGTNWDKVRLFLFERTLVLIDLNGVLIAQIDIKNEISSIARFVSGIRLNLHSEAIPELQICSEIPLITSRLEYYFKKVLGKQAVPETSLFQLTTNGWGLIKDNYMQLPVDILRFHNCIENNLEIPEDLLMKSMPSPEVTPLNLILAITLLNNTELSNAEYRAKIINFLDATRKEMRPFDKLSLIFVGIDGSRVPSKRGSYIGSVEPNWSGWDSIYNEVRVQSNMNSNFEPILANGWDELQVCLSKCEELLPFSTCSLNKLVVVSSNTYDNFLVSNSTITYIESQIKTLLHANEKNLSIDFFRIGTTYYPELEFGQKYCLLPLLVHNDVLKVPYGSKLLRFNDFESFSLEFKEILKNTYHNIVLPNISLDILKMIGTRDFVNFHKLEVNGRMLEIENFSNLKLLVNNVNVNHGTNIMLKLTLDSTRLSFDDLSFGSERSMEIPLLSYMASWLNESDDYKVLHTRLYEERNYNTFNTLLDGSLTPPMSSEPETHFQMSSIPSGRHEKYIRKEIELEITRALKSLNESQLMNNHIVLNKLLTFLTEIKRSLDDIELPQNIKSADDLKTHSLPQKESNLTKYLDSLLNELNSISNSIDVNEFQTLIACKDLTNWLV